MAKAKQTARFDLRFPPDMAEALSVESSRQDRAASAIIREALAVYLRNRGHRISSRIRRGRQASAE